MQVLYGEGAGAEPGLGLAVAGGVEVGHGLHGGRVLLGQVGAGVGAVGEGDGDLVLLLAVRLLLQLHLLLLVKVLLMLLLLC